MIISTQVAVVDVVSARWRRGALQAKSLLSRTERPGLILDGAEAERVRSVVSQDHTEAKSNKLC